jgi:hypothetical protein
MAVRGMPACAPLLQSNGTNYGSQPRMCQYITMWPHEMSYWPTYRTTGDTREQQLMVSGFGSLPYPCWLCCALRA